MVYRCHVRGALDMGALPQLLNPILTAEGDARASGEILLDLSDVSFITPGGVAPFAALIESVCHDLPPVRLQAPSDPECARYLASSGLLQMLLDVAAAGGADELRVIRPGSALNTVLPLTRLGGNADLAALVDQLALQLDGLLGCADDAWTEAKGRIISAVREICANVFQHANGAPGWVSAQKYFPKDGGSPFLEVSIADAGVGIRPSLAGRYPELANVPDGDVLARMVREQLSRHNNPARGCGYYTLREATAKLDGSFWLRSGSGEATRRRRRSLDHQDGLPFWPGTHLQMRVTCAPDHLRSAR